MKLLNKKGQSLTEYLILTALISVGSIAVVQLVSRNIRTKFSVVNDAILGKEKPGQVGEKSSEKHYRKLDMTDFAEDAKYHEE